MFDAEVKALLKELKAGLEATVVGIIDGGRGWLHSSSERSPGTFWAAFTGLDCLQGEWGDWDQELLASGAAGVMCRCGAHAVRTVMIHTRWIFVVLSEGGLVAGADKVIDQATQVLKGLLPSGHPPASPDTPVDGGPSGGGPAPAELGIPIAWIRRRSS
jgi:hypothetical protein